MPDRIDALLRHAADRLDASRDLLRLGHWEDGVGRSYYAMFSAARALLHAKGSKPLTHAGVLSELGRLYVRPGLLAVEVAGKLRKGRDRRADADYGAGETAVPFTQSEAEALHRDAEAFVAEARKLLGR